MRIPKDHRHFNGNARSSLKTLLLSLSMDSRVTVEHYVRKEWPAKVTYIPENANIKEIPLVDTKNILMPSYQIKFSLMKNFVKEPGKSKSNEFAFFATSFPIKVKQN